eukprot:CAMPEP_0170752412 /NCGR_PEP_ID=MMETSP0437-20130122/11955_1 /TAXON_ID=0 /ORGANISM="Sexangularia sp." /LENGTH=510 /DNA_ID=CAMNT_0011091481 /DNA_START=26 /DNA_END=1558 /DNA_ORIENTATION=-
MSISHRIDTISECGFTYDPVVLASKVQDNVHLIVADGTTGYTLQLPSHTTDRSTKVQGRRQVNVGELGPLSGSPLVEVSDSPSAALQQHRIELPFVVHGASCLSLPNAQTKDDEGDEGDEGNVARSLVLLTSRCPVGTPSVHLATLHLGSTPSLRPIVHPSLPRNSTPSLSSTLQTVPDSPTELTFMLAVDATPSPTYLPFTGQLDEAVDEAITGAPTKGSVAPSPLSLSLSSPTALPPPVTLSTADTVALVVTPSHSVSLSLTAAGLLTIHSLFAQKLEQQFWVEREIHAPADANSSERAPRGRTVAPSTLPLTCLSLGVVEEEVTDDSVTLSILVGTTDTDLLIYSYTLSLAGQFGSGSSTRPSKRRRKRRGATSSSGLTAPPLTTVLALGHPAEAVRTFDRRILAVAGGGQLSLFQRSVSSLSLSLAASRAKTSPWLPLRRMCLSTLAVPSVSVSPFIRVDSEEPSNALTLSLFVAPVALDKSEPQTVHTITLTVGDEDEDKDEDDE